tara:strand:- start:165 stop:455 length:291 start_codon:yes stop_codon:yes gene_type:complete
MKITKERLKTLIHEELQKIAEEEGEMTSSDFRQATRKRGAGSLAGIAPDELALINKVTKQLQLIASKKNLGASGQVTTLLKRLIPLLDAETQKIGE